MRLLIAAYPWSLYQVLCHIRPFCWFKNEQGYKAELRDDGLIYRAGFKTKAQAIEWAKKQDILPQDFREEEHDTAPTQAN